MSADPKRLTFDEERLAEDFLLEAFRVLFDTGNPAKLGIRELDLQGKSIQDQAAAIFAARQRALRKRMELARMAVLLTAIGVEAAANTYIAVMLPDHVEPLDDLKTINKLLVAPALATGTPLFFEGTEPIGQLRTLFKLRNRIVHPKVGKHAIVGEPGIADYTPRAAAECLIAAARAIGTLHEALQRDDDQRDSAPAIILDHRDELRELSRKWTDKLPVIRKRPPRLRKRPPRVRKRPSPDS